MTCEKKELYFSKAGKCCNRCPAGTHKKADCDSTKETECVPCGRGLYTDTNNQLDKCRICTECSPTNNKRKVMDCTAKEDTVCECVAGFYCNDAHCEYCQPVTKCPEGEGVKVKATRMNDTICAPCEKGTYSNTLDYLSRCQAHTSCEDLGKMLKIPGTTTTDAICGDFKSHCPWILPACLWSGFVLTALIVFGLICLRAKRKSYRAGVKASSRVPELPETSAAPVIPLELTLKSMEPNGHCQESCSTEACELPLFNPGDNEVCCSTQDSVDSSFPITPLKASVSFAETSHNNGDAGYCKGNFLRTYSEPQEDEWCGT